MCDALYCTDTWILWNESGLIFHARYGQGERIHCRSTYIVCELEAREQCATLKNSSTRFKFQDGVHKVLPDRSYD